MGTHAMRWQTLILFCLVFGQCTLFQKSVKIKPITFDYGSISRNYFGPDQNKPFPLTVLRGNNLYNSVTKDGRYLFFATDQNGNFDIWFRDTQSSLVVPVTNHPSMETKPAISPDGRFLVFESREFDPNGDLVLLEIDPEEWTKELLKGNRFVSRDFVNLTNPDGNNPNKQERVLDTDPIWSPDGKSIFFVSEKLTPGIPNLVQMDPFRKGSLQLWTDKGAFQPSLSADGKTVYFVSYMDSDLGEIYSLDFATKKIERITTNTSIDLSPSVDSKNRYLYFASIPKDTNGNGKLDDRDNSLLIMKTLESKSERRLTTGESSVFDIRYSDFNGGSILFSASLSNAINVYFIPEGGSIPKRADIVEQFDYARTFEKQSIDGYFLALDSIEMFFERDPLYPIYSGLVAQRKWDALVNKGKKKESEAILENLKERAKSKEDLFAKAMVLYLTLDPKVRSKTLEKLAIESEKLTLGKDVLPAIYHLIYREAESSRERELAYRYLVKIQEGYPDYHLKSEIRRRIGTYQLSVQESKLPPAFEEIFADWQAEQSAFISDPNREFNPTLKKDLRFALESFQTQFYALPLQTDKRSILENWKSKSNLPPLLMSLVRYLEAELLSNERMLNESNVVLDSLIPIPLGIDLEPPGKPSVFEDRRNQALYLNPVLLQAGLLKYKNERSRGNTSEALRNLKIYLEFYDPDLGVNLKVEELQNAFFYFENKAIEFERQKDLLQSSFHYFFNNQTMFLVKTRNLYLESIYKEYAVYYQRKMVDTIFNYGKKLKEEEERALLNQLNILSKDKLNVVGNISGVTSILTDNKLLRSVADVRDLEKIEVMSESALQWTELYYKQAVPRARPYLDLATLYGYAYYLINKNAIYESYYYATDTMTEARKEEILSNYKKAEWELRWIIFADPTYHDAYQLLGWLYQYIDLIKQKKPSRSEESDEERYANLYARFFPSKHLEENVELYSQILVFLGEDKTDPKVISDLNLNLSNNFFLLNDYPKASEGYSKVEKASRFLLKKDQFENYRQEAIFRYNYGRSLVYQGSYRKASEQFSEAIQIYFQEEYYQKIKTSANLPLAESEESLAEVRSKLALLYALKGLSDLESGNSLEAVSSFQSAIAYNNSVSFLDPINLHNYLAIALQKQGRYIESHENLKKADEHFSKRSKSFLQKIRELSFWNLVFPDSLRVIGEGRFPGEFPDEFKYLLTLGIRIENHIEQREYAKANQALEFRNQFIKDKSLEKTVMGGLVLTKSNQIKAQIFYESKRYPEASKSYFELWKKVKASKGGNNIKKIALSGLSNSIFSAIESKELNDKEAIQSLEALNLELKEEKDLGTNLLQAVASIYRARLYEQEKKFIEASEEFGKAIFILKEPNFIEEGRTQSVSTKEQVRGLINVATLYFQWGRDEQFQAVWKEAFELAYEFQLDEELFYLHLLKVREFNRMANGKDKERNRASIEKVVSEIERIWKDQIFIRLYAKRTNLQGFYDTMAEFYGYKNAWEKSVTLWEEKRDVELFRDAMQAQFEFSDSKLNLLYLDIKLSYRNIRKLYQNWEDKNLNREKSIGLANRLKDEMKNLERLTFEFRKINPDKSHFFSPLTAKKWQPNEFSNQWLGVIEGPDRIVLLQVVASKMVSRICLKPLTKDSCPLPNSESSVQLQGMGQSFTIDLAKDWQKHLNSLGKTVTFLFDHSHSEMYQEKKERAWNKQIILEKEKKLNRVRLFDSDVLVSKTAYPIEANIFADDLSENLPLRELFISPGSEISAVIGKESWIEKPMDWHLIGAQFQVLRSSQIQNLVLLSKSKETLTAEVSKSEIESLTGKGEALVIGSWEPKLQQKKDLKIAESLAKEAKSFEKSREWQQAFSKFYAATTYLEPSDENYWTYKIRMSQIKLQLYPEISSKEAFLPLLNESNDSKTKNKILYSYYVSCYMNRNKSNADKCNKIEVGFEGEEKEKYLSAVRFYEQMRQGNLTNWQTAFLSTKLLETEEDPILRNQRIGSLFIQNLMFSDALQSNHEAESFAKTQKEKNIIKNRELEILFHKAFLFGDGDIYNSNLKSTSTYSLGFRKDWAEFDSKIGAREFTKFGYADSIYDDYRLKIYQNWKNWETVKTFEPLSLTPEYLTSGDSVLSKLSSLNRSLLFYILSESLSLQKENEVSALIELLAKQEELDGFESRAIGMRLELARKQLLLGNQELSSDFRKKSNLPDFKKLEQNPVLNELWLDLNKKVSYLNNEDSVKNGNVEDIWNFALVSDPTLFIKQLGKHAKTKWKTGISPREREEWEFLFYHYLNQSLMKNKSEVFYDVAMARELFRNFQSRFWGDAMGSRPIPVFKEYAENLKAKIPENQELSTVVELGSKAMYLSFSKGKSQGRELFSDQKLVKKDFYQYVSNSFSGGIHTLARDSLSDRLRNQLRLAKGKRHYLHLTGAYASFPVSFPLETEVYFISSPSTLLENNSIPKKDFLNQGSPSIEVNEGQLSASEKVVLDLVGREIKAEKGERAYQLNFNPLHLERGAYLALGGDPVCKEVQSKSTKVVIYGNSRLGEKGSNPYDYGNWSNCLSKLNKGLYGIHSGYQAGLHSVDFAKSFFLSPSPYLLQRFEEGKQSAKARNFEDRYWVGLRLYTSTFLVD